MPFLYGCQTSNQQAPVEGINSSIPMCPVVEEQQCPVCPEPQIIERIVNVPVSTPSSISRSETGEEPLLQVVGAVEWAFVESANLRMEARIDTGAETTSIHAEDIQLIEIDGLPVVRYSLINPENAEKVQQESPLVREARIKQQGGGSDLRYVVNLWVSLGDNREQIEVNLTDRNDFEYPLLIGRNMLVDMAIVDVSRHHTLP